MKGSLGVLADSKLNMSQECTSAAMKANGILGCICMGHYYRDGDVLFRPHLEYSPLLISSVQERCGHTRQGKKEMMIKGLENLLYQKRLKELGLFFLEDRSHRGNHITVS